MENIKYIADAHLLKFNVRDTSLSRPLSRPNLM
jgi:hypothetical protein